MNVVDVDADATPENYVAVCAVTAWRKKSNWKSEENGTGRCVYKI